MPLVANDVTLLTDARGRDIGRFAIDEVRGGLVLGSFSPGGDYDAVRPVFDRFDEAVDAQALSVVDDIDKEIAALGICVNDVPVWDVQIYRDGAASFRLPPPAGRNGTHH